MPIYDGTADNDTLNGSPGDDSLYGSTGQDRIITGDGKDYVEGGPDNDQINGYLVDPATGKYSYWASGGAKDIRGGDGDDFIYGGPGQDFLSGDAGNDYVVGGGGNDTLRGYAGKDSLYGGAGNDSILGDADADTIDGRGGADFLSGGDGDDQIFSQESGSATLLGGNGDDTLNAYTGTDNKLLDGESGHDRLDGGSGNDTLMGGAGNDTLNASDGHDSLEGGSENDSLSGGDGNDSIAGGAGDDTLNGGAGLDVLSGGEGNDTLYSRNTGMAASFNDGANVMDGGAGDDLIYGGLGKDTLTGGDGQDSLNGDDGSDVLLGGDGNDSLWGGDGHDSLVAGAGDDSLTGGAGDDTLDGSTGIDTLRGGEGNDTYFISDVRQFIQDAGGAADAAYVSASFTKIPSSVENVVYINAALPLPYWIDALLPDEAAGLHFLSLLGNSKTFDYAFPNARPAYLTEANDVRGWAPLSPVQQQRAFEALAYISSVVDLSFVASAVADAPNTIAFGTNDQTGSAGYARYPSSTSLGSDLLLDNSDSTANTTLADGSPGALTLIHELGHALGLEHPFASVDIQGTLADPSHLSETEDQTRWSAMSYTESPEQYVLQYSPLDIAALQYVYGPSPSSRSGDDTYTIDPNGPSFIWDGGGIDTLSAENCNQGCTIFLTPGHWGFAGSARAALITAPGQITVNFGTLIENLRGSGYGDALTGNELNNRIEGGSGDDSLDGGLGKDTLDGGDGQDTAVYALAASNYTVTSLSTGRYQVLAKTGSEGQDTVLNVENLKFADQAGGIASFVAQAALSAVAQFWKDATLTPSEARKAEAVNLSDAIGILKMIVGLNVNSNSTPLSPYQAIAADFDQNGKVELTDAIGVLKMVVGLNAPSPAWRYYDDAKLTVAYQAAESLNPEVWTTTAAVVDASSAASSVKLVGVLAGDVDGSWSG
jgi:Ca2+-binding RTX toxin-like protein